MNVITDNAYRQSWQRLGKTLPKPQLILCVSAHWLTKGWYVTGMEKPRTIHDFGGFPQELFDQQYPASGHPEAAKEIAELLGAEVDGSEWGYDHGSWGVLKPMYPAADIPVIQLSLDWHAHPEKHFEMGQKLRALRDYGVLIVGSGNTVHNLRMMGQGAPHDWNVEFDHFVKAKIESGDLAGLAKFQDLGAVAKLAHPSYDHYLPLLHSAGAADPSDKVSFFNDTYDLRSLAMRSVIWESGN